MSERVRWTWSRVRAPLLALSLFTASAVAAACTENLEGGAACPSLCPEQSEQFRDTIIEAVALDTSLGGYPVLGLASNLVLANRPDTLVTRAVIRFDQLTTAFAPNAGSGLDSITTVDSVFLKVPLDTTGRRGAAPIAVQVYDVDTTANDSTTSVVRSLYRADRLIGQVTITPTTTGDTLRIPLSRTVMQAKIAAKGRLRVGLRLSGPGQLRLRAFTFGVGSSTLQYDPASDTLYRPIVVTTGTTISGASPEVNLAYTVYAMTDVGSLPPGPNTLVVGGYPAYRSYLRFNVPLRISDSSTIVRADLLLTQRPSRFTNAADTVAVFPLVPTATVDVIDLNRVLDLAAEGTLAGLDTTRFVPRDSGQKALNVLGLARTWRSLPTNVPRALALRIGLEGSQPAELRFFSRTAPAALRPKLRISYLPKSEFVLP
ncbi:MAG: hypothetical protein ACOVSI_07060 [Gemmatimonas sp.]